MFSILVWYEHNYDHDWEILPRRTTDYVKVTNFVKLDKN